MKKISMKIFFFFNTILFFNINSSQKNRITVNNAQGLEQISQALRRYRQEADDGKKDKPKKPDTASLVEQEGSRAIKK